MIAFHEESRDDAIPPRWFYEPFAMADIQEPHGSGPTKIAATLSKLKIALIFVAGDREVEVATAVASSLSTRGMFIVTLVRDPATAAAIKHIDSSIVNLNMEHSVGTVYRGIVAPFVQNNAVQFRDLKKFLPGKALGWLSLGEAKTAIEAVKEALFALGEKIHRASAVSVAFSASGGRANLLTTKNAAANLRAQISPNCSQLSYAWTEEPSNAEDDFFVSVLCIEPAA